MQKIDNVILHKLMKEKHGKVSVVERSAALSLTEPVKKLVIDIHDLYASRASKGYGRFQADEVNYPSARILRAAFKEKTIDFADASRQLLAVLAAKANQAALATRVYASKLVVIQ